MVAALRAAGCVFAEDEAALLLTAAGDEAALAQMLARRVAGVPIEQVVGWADFCGVRIDLDEGVFVPRRRSGLLVGEAARRARPGAVVVDLCCGSGAVGAAVAARVGGIELHAADLDPTAVACARRNLAGCGGQVHGGDLYAALPAGLRGSLDVLAVNAPYVPTAELALLPAEARDHEPRLALDGGADGLDVQRRVAADAAGWLAPGGRLLIETGAHQAATTAALLTAVDLDASTVTCDDLEATVVIGVRA